MLLGALQKKYAGTGYEYSAKTQSETEDFYSSISSAVQNTEERDEGDVIGLPTIPYGNTNVSYGMAARYAKESTSENPVMQAATNYSGGNDSYNDNVDEINPRFASAVFEKYAPNAPTEVRKAWQEAAEECGSDGIGIATDGKMAYISQMLVKCVENRHNGAVNPDDIFGSTVMSALQAARELLYDLENPLTSQSGRGAQVAQYIEAEKEFYRTFIKKLEQTEVAGEEETDYLVKFKQMINEMYEKVKNGETEPTFQIGARAFTLREWEEFLENFDSIEAAVRELMREAHEERKEELAEQKAVQTEILQEKFEQITLLVSETTKATYPSAEEEKEDIMYITWYTQDGIFCRKAGQTQGYEWIITFDDSSQYDKVMNFLEQFPEGANLRFASHENFWQDFLNDELDVAGFMNFFATTNNGVPDYSIRIGDSMYIDKEKMAYAKYMNPLGTHFYTVEEMWEMQLAAIEARLNRKSDSTNRYKVASDSLLSICHVPTGETANVYKANNYSEDNPVYVVRGTAANGSDYEYQINADEINPNNCSYIELLAWSVHNGRTSPSDYLKLARLRGESNASYLKKIDYMKILCELMEQMKQAGAFEEYLEYKEWVDNL